MRIGPARPSPIHAPLCEIARLNKPFASGDATSDAIAIAPADWPNTVTLSGSPPNAAMLFFTQRADASMSMSP